MLDGVLILSESPDMSQNVWKYDVAGHKLQGEVYGWVVKNLKAAHCMWPTNLPLDMH